MPTRDQISELQREIRRAAERGERKPIDNAALRAPIPEPTYPINAVGFAADKKMDEQIREIEYQIALIKFEKKKAAETRRKAADRALRGTHD